MIWSSPTDDHPLRVRTLVEELGADQRFAVLKLNWASGIMVCVRRP